MNEVSDERLRAFGLDATDLSMLESGDMLGSKVGAKFVSLIASQAGEIAVLREALDGLVAKLDAMEKPVNAVIAFAFAHNYEYTGPNYADEVAKARAALSTPVKTAD